MPGLYINGEWLTGQGELFYSLNPATGEPVWEGEAANAEQVDAAVSAARLAANQWAFVGFDARCAIARAYA
ncbi:aldehyde dehydrogenase family protein, partial [Neptunomonas phycophila]